MSKVELDKLKEEYYDEYIEGHADTGKRELINNLFRSYLEQVGQNLEKSYSQFLEERVGGNNG